jgi:hypothetical protein
LPHLTLPRPSIQISDVSPTLNSDLCPRRSNWMERSGSSCSTNAVLRNASSAEIIDLAACRHLTTKSLWLSTGMSHFAVRAHLPGREKLIELHLGTTFGFLCISLALVPCWCGFISLKPTWHRSSRDIPNLRRVPPAHSSTSPGLHLELPHSSCETAI